MKRFVPLLGIAVLTIALGACSNTGTPTATDDTGSTASVAVTIDLPSSDASSVDTTNGSTASEAAGVSGSQSVSST